MAPSLRHHQQRASRKHQGMVIIGGHTLPRRLAVWLALKDVARLKGQCSKHRLLAGNKQRSKHSKHQHSKHQRQKLVKQALSQAQDGTAILHAAKSHPSPPATRPRKQSPLPHSVIDLVTPESSTQTHGPQGLSDNAVHSPPAPSPISRAISTPATTLSQHQATLKLPANAQLSLDWSKPSPSCLLAAHALKPQLSTARLSKAFNTPNCLVAEIVTATTKALQVHGRDMRTLLPSDAWLNDEIINFYLRIVQTRNDQYHQHHQAQQPPAMPTPPPSSPTSSRHHVPRVYVFSSFFFTQLTLPQGRPITGPTASMQPSTTRCGPYHYQYGNVQRWTLPNRTGTSDCVLWRELIIIPINIQNSHWCVVALWPHKQLIQMYDSLPSSDRSAHILRTISRWYTQDCIDKAQHAPGRQGQAAPGTGCAESAHPTCPVASSSSTPVTVAAAAAMEGVQPSKASPVAVSASAAGVALVGQVVDGSCAVGDVSKPVVQVSPSAGAALQGSMSGRSEMPVSEGGVTKKKGRNRRHKRHGNKTASHHEKRKENWKRKRQQKAKQRTGGDRPASPVPAPPPIPSPPPQQQPQQPSPQGSAQKSQPQQQEQLFSTQQQQDQPPSAQQQQQQEQPPSTQQQQESGSSASHTTCGTAALSALNTPAGHPPLPTPPAGVQGVLLAQQQPQAQHQKPLSTPSQCQPPLSTSPQQQPQAQPPPQAVQLAVHTLVPGVPLQPDGSSCGVFTCAFAELLSRGVLPPFTISPAQVHSMRLGMAAEILGYAVKPVAL